MTNESGAERRARMFPQSYRPQPHFEHSYRPPVQEKELAVRELTVERKKFTLRLMENSRGRFLRIMENPADGIGHGQKAAIIVPGTGLQDFLDVVRDIASKFPTV